MRRRIGFGTTSALLTLQIILAYGSLMVTLWTPRAAQTPWVLLTSSSVLIFTLTGPYSVRELGMRWGKSRAATAIILAGTLVAVAIVLSGRLAGLHTNLDRWASWQGPARYFLWALAQQFLLQSYFFFLRLESLLGEGKGAVLAAAALFMIAHIPNPVLTCATLAAGLLSCEAFRRYRALLPLGVAHGLIGLALAVTVPDSIMHHMKVGLGYLR